MSLTDIDVVLKKNKKKSIYVVLPEPHIWDKNISSRTNYQAEIKKYMEDFRQLLLTQRPLTDNLYLLMMGDLFHQGMKDKEENIYWYNYFHEVSEIVDGVFSLIGNHEVTYQKDNLFWSLTETIESEWYKCQDQIVVSPKGRVPVIRVVDTLTDGPLEIHFGHYTRVVREEYDPSRVKVLLTHNSIMTKEVSNILKNRYGRDPLDRYMDYTYLSDDDVLRGFNRVYLGHMHTAYGVFTADRGDHLTHMHYLASLGRTNVREVNDDDLERAIPIISLTDNNVVEFKEETLYLLPNKDAVNEVRVEKNKAVYQKTKKRSEIRKTVFLGVSPLETFKTAVAKHRGCSLILDMALTGDTLEYMEALERGLSDEE